MSEYMPKLELFGDENFSYAVSPAINIKSATGEVFHGQFAEVICPIQEINTHVYAAMLFSNNDQPLGYLVFNQAENEDKATASINYLKTKQIQAKSEVFPTPLLKGIEKSNVFDAFKIFEEYQGQGYASDLWVLGLAYLHERGIKQVEISGDITIGMKRSGESFYTQMGAKVIDGHEIVDVKTIVNNNQEKLSRMFST